MAKQPKPSGGSAASGLATPAPHPSGLPLGLSVHRASLCYCTAGSLLDARGKDIVTRLGGKAALITGGGTGIGRAIALAFAREGARVAVAGRRAEKLCAVVEEVRQAGGEAIAVVCDVAESADAGRAVRETARRLGGLHVLVNNAGTLSVSTVESISEKEWDRVMAVNLKGPFLMSRAALPEFRKAGGGVIVNVGSVLGLFAMEAARGLLRFEGRPGHAHQSHGA